MAVIILLLVMISMVIRISLSRPLPQLLMGVAREGGPRERLGTDAKPIIIIDLSFSVL